MLTNRFLGSILIITGTCVGAGMLGLPVVSAPIGFFNSLVVLVLMWLFMCFTGLLVLEVNLWFPFEVSYISMARETLGLAGKYIAGALFLLLLYSLMVAYLMSGADLLISLGDLLGVHIPEWLGILPWLLAFGGLVYSGTSAVDFVNKYFMLGLALTFAAMATFIAPHMIVNLRTGIDYSHELAVLPIFITAFGYHIVIPSVSTYLDGHIARLQRVIILGSLLPLLIYIVWQWLIFSIIPAFGDNSLTTILHTGNAAGGLGQEIALLTGHGFVAVCIRFFIFFAVASSFLGVSLGLFDLLADGLHVRKNHAGRLNLAGLTFVPPAIFTLFYPQGFIKALGYAGLFVALLHGLLPALMVWAGRARSHFARESRYRVVGGQFALLLVMAISLMIVYAEVAVNLQWI